MPSSTRDAKLAAGARQRQADRRSETLLRPCHPRRRQRAPINHHQVSLHEKHQIEARSCEAQARCAGDPTPRRPTHGSSRRCAGTRRGDAVQRQQGQGNRPRKCGCAATRARLRTSGLRHRGEHPERGECLGQDRPQRAAVRRRSGRRLAGRSAQRRQRPCADDEPGRGDRRQPEFTEGRPARPDPA